MKTDREKYLILRTACIVVLARFRVAAGKKTDKDAWQHFQKNGSIKEIITAMRL